MSSGEITTVVSDLVGQRISVYGRKGWIVANRPAVTCTGIVRAVMPGQMFVEIRGPATDPDPDWGPTNIDDISDARLGELMIVMFESSYIRMLP